MQVNDILWHAAWVLLNNKENSFKVPLLSLNVYDILIFEKTLKLYPKTMSITEFL